MSRWHFWIHHSTARTHFWQSSTYLWEIICDVHTSERSKSFLMYATFSNIWQKNTFPFVTKNPCHKMANGHWQTWILETSDIHFSSTVSTQNFKGFCGKTNIKMNRKVGIKIENPLWGICPLSVPSKYLFLCARKKFGFNKKIRRKLLIVYMCYQQNSCTTPMEHGLEETF